MIDNSTQVLVQGITGKEGTRVTKWMLDYDTKVVAGVTPGKGGQEVEGVPVFNTVVEAFDANPDISATTLYVPPRFVRTAAEEFFNASPDRPTLMHIIGEGVPLHDTAWILENALARNVTVVGPASIGLIRPGIGKIGSIGGGENDSFKKGNIAVISKSGGLASEVSLMLRREGLGQSFALGTGGDMLVGTTFADALTYLENDDDTRAIVLIGEVGGTYEQLAATLISEGRATKPVIAYISGIFAESMPRGTAVGHAGAIIEGEQATRTSKIDALKSAGAIVAQSLDQVGKLVRGAIQ